MSDTPITIRNVEFPGFPRPFTVAEHREYLRIEAEHGFPELREKAHLQEGKRTNNPVDARLQAIRDKITLLEERQKRELDRDDFRPEVLSAVTEEVAKAREEEARLAGEHVPEFIEAAREWEEITGQLVEVQERVYLETVHAIAELHKIKVPPLEEWMDGATVEDYDRAAEVVEEGLTSTPLNRASRRAVQRRVRSSKRKSGRSPVASPPKK